MVDCSLARLRFGLLEFDEVRFANGLTLLGGSPYAGFRENRVLAAFAA